MGDEIARTLTLGGVTCSTSVPELYRKVMVRLSAPAGDSRAATTETAASEATAPDQAGGSSFFLTYGSKLLDDTSVESTTGDYGISANATLTLSARGRGGGCKPSKGPRSAQGSSLSPTMSKELQRRIAALTGPEGDGDGLTFFNVGGEGTAADAVMAEVAPGEKIDVADPSSILRCAAKGLS